MKVYKPKDDPGRPHIPPMWFGIIMLLIVLCLWLGYVLG